MVVETKTNLSVAMFEVNLGPLMVSTMGPRWAHPVQVHFALHWDLPMALSRALHWDLPMALSRALHWDLPMALSRALRRGLL
jgi:hypothetical protein